MAFYRNWRPRIRQFDWKAWSKKRIIGDLCDDLCADHIFGVVNVDVLTKAINLADVESVRECMLLHKGTRDGGIPQFDLRNFFGVNIIRYLLSHAKNPARVPKDYVRVFDANFGWDDLRVCDERREDIEAVLRTAAKNGWCLTYKMLADGIKYFECRYANISDGYTNEICIPARENVTEATPHAQVSYKGGSWYLAGVTYRASDRAHKSMYDDLRQEFDDFKAQYGQYVELVNHLEQQKHELEKHKQDFVDRIVLCNRQSAQYERAIKAYEQATKKGKPVKKNIELPPVRTYHHI